MNFLDTLYGSQYWEIHQKGRDGNKGRTNGNMLLMGLIVLILLVTLLSCISFIPGFESKINQWLRGIFGRASGKSVGKLIAIPFAVLIYFILSATIGNEKNFKKRVDAFMQLPEEKKKRDYKLIMIPYVILGVILMALAFYNM